MISFCLFTIFCKIFREIGKTFKATDPLFRELSSIIVEKRRQIHEFESQQQL